MNSWLFLLLLVALLATTAAGNRNLRSVDTEERGVWSRLVDSVSAHVELHKFSSELKTMAKKAKTAEEFDTALKRLDELEAHYKAMVGMGTAVKNIENTRFYLWFKMEKLPKDIENPGYGKFYKATLERKAAKKARPVAATSGWAVH